MLKVYFAERYYMVDNEDLMSCGRRGYVIRDDSQPTKCFHLKKADWDSVIKETINLDGLTPGETFFRHRPYLEVSRGWYDDHPRRFYQGDFKEFTYVTVYKEWEHCSLEWIMKHASAEQAIQYMKERGMSVCPLQ